MLYFWENVLNNKINCSLCFCLINNIIYTYNLVIILVFNLVYQVLFAQIILKILIQ